jgi:hypothetical protein
MATKPKSTPDYDSKLYIGNELAALDRKDRGYYDSMTEEEQKKFSPYLMIRWGATVEGEADLQAYYLMSTNERLNKNFFDISASQHKRLQWLLATTVSPGMGCQRHPWLAAKKKDSGNNKAEKFLRELYPNAKSDEIALMAQINSKDELKELAKSLGMDSKQIKDSL